MVLGLLGHRGDDHLHEPFPGILGGERALDDRLQLVEAILEDRVHERLLGREAAIQRAHPDARAAGDLVHADIQAVLGEGAAGGLDDPLAVALRVASKGGAHAQAATASASVSGVGPASSPLAARAARSARSRMMHGTIASAVRPADHQNAVP